MASVKGAAAARRDRTYTSAMAPFALHHVDAPALEGWVDDLRSGDVVLHARRGGEGERRSYRFRDPVATLALPAGGDVHALLRQLERHLDAGRAIAGYLGYEAGAALVGLPPAPPPPYALAWFGAYDRAETVDPGEGGAPLAPPAAPAGTLGEARLELDAASWAERVGAVHAALAAGESYQVNLTTAYRCRVGDVRQAYRALSAAQPVPFGALLDSGELQLASCSPELFVRATRDDGDRTLALTTRPMKGTAPRQPDPDADARAAEALRADPKSRAENVMIVDLLRHDLGRLARPGSVAVRDLLAAEPYRTVWQLTSTVTAAARPDVGLAALLAALFPCGSVTGAPKRRTMELIAALEGAPRGVYTGAIGFALPGGPSEPAAASAPAAPGVPSTSVWSVAIRTLVVQRGEGRLGVGGGIVIDSEPDAEYAELVAKGRFLTHPQPAPTLFETMRWEGGRLLRWPRHRDRMARSAATLGLHFDAERALATALAAAHEALAGGAAAPLRVRLELQEGGACTAAARPHVDGGADDALRVVWSERPIAAADPARRHKTTDRALYDAASAWAQRAGVADVLFLNEAGRVAEGAISTLFVADGDGRWRTPPLADGALPGVLRAELLDAGEAVEAPLTPADLIGRPLALGSALRGLRPVILDERPRWRPDVPEAAPA